MTPVLPSAESLTVEFKSDRKRLPDSDLVEAIVCLANAECGTLWLGVENGDVNGWKRMETDERCTKQPEFAPSMGEAQSLCWGDQDS